MSGRDPVVAAGGPPSREVRGWWQRRLNRFEQQATLGSAVLAGRWSRYALYRLRAVFAVRGGSAILHIVEALVVTRFALGSSAVFGFAVANLALVVAGAWWGATEVLRRELRAGRRPQDADAIAERWIVWATRAGLGVVGCAIAVAWTQRELGVVAAYGAVVVGRVAIDLPLRVWHSRVYAYRRIYRSPWVQIATDAIGPVILIAFAGTLGAVALVIALIASSLGSRLVTLYYVKRAHQQLRIRWLPLRLRLRRAASARVAVGPILAYGLAGVATRVPNVIGFVVLSASQLPLNVAIGLHLVVGVFMFASAWPWTHYHDLIPLEAGALSRARRWIERAIMREGLVVGLFIAVMSVAVLVGLTPRSLPLQLEPGVVLLVPPRLPSPLPYAWALPALAIALTLLAGVQAIAWARGRPGAVIVGGFVALAAIALTPMLAQAIAGQPWKPRNVAPVVLVVGHLLLAITLLAITIGTLVHLRHAKERTLRGQVAWLDALAAAHSVPSEVWRVRVARGGDIADRICLPIVAGARYWARQGRWLLVSGVPPDVLRARALASGWGVAVEPNNAPADRMPGAAARPDAVTLTLGRRLTLDGPAAGGVDHVARLMLWRALLAHVAGRQGSREARVIATRLEGAELAIVVFALRTPSAETPA